MQQREKRPFSFYVLAAFFVLFVLFLYGPMSAIFILSFQGPNGGLTFPLNGVSVHWFGNLFEKQAVGDFGASFSRSLLLGLMVMVSTVLVALLAGLAFRRRFLGGTPLFYLTIASLVVPSIIVSLGIGVLFQQIGFRPAWWTSGFGAHLTWTLPFGVLIMFAVFNRFSPSYEEAARDLGASPWQTFRHVLLPMIAPSLI
ncbi:MAG: transporter permease, partial [Devosia sp.]|nr:transporter permease [Devosia sp.]